MYVLLFLLGAFLVPWAMREGQPRRQLPRGFLDSERRDWP
jgi:hypothetical protein